MDLLGMANASELTKKFDWRKPPDLKMDSGKFDHCSGCMAEDFPDQE
jgi:hypothetical protein